jgi:hypothetical protein
LKLDEAVLDGPTWTDEVERYAVAVGPPVYLARDELGAIVDGDGLRVAALGDDRLQGDGDLSAFSE